MHFDRFCWSAHKNNKGENKQNQWRSFAEDEEKRKIEVSITLHSTTMGAISRCSLVKTLHVADRLGRKYINKLLKPSQGE